MSTLPQQGKLTRMITFSYLESAESAQAKEYASLLVVVQHQRHVLGPDGMEGVVPRKGSQTPADLILELKREVQRQARLTVVVPRKGSQTTVKSGQERQHQTLLRKRCQLPSLSQYRDHEDAYRGTGHRLHYRVHHREPAL